MWIKVTAHDGTSTRVNMDKVSTYYPHDEGKGKTFLEYENVDDSGLGLHIKETVDQIDNLMQPLVCSTGWH